MYDLIIIGGGPAGITAGIYAARKKLNTLLITKEWGGQIIDASEVENWPGTQKISGLDLTNQMKEHLNNFELEKKEGREVINLEKKENFLIRDDKKEEYEAKTVLIATGKIPRSLDIPGEKEFKGKGLSICSTCDAPMLKDKDVAIIGGGNVGFNMALDLSKYANKIYVLEFLEKTQGDELLKEKLEKTGKVEIYTNVAVKEIKGSQFVESLVYENRDGGENKELKVQGVFVAIGMMTKAGFAEGLVELNKEGEIMIDKDNNTKTQGLFAAGDITDVKYEQIVIAASEGAKATLSAHDYLKKL